MKPDMDAVSKDLATRWGQRTRDAIHPLSALLAETISAGDLLAFGFVVMSLSGVVAYATEMAKAVQSGAQGTVGGPEDIPQSETVH